LVKTKKSPLILIEKYSLKREKKRSL